MKQLRIVLLLVALVFSTNAISQTVYTTKTGEKFHKSNCRYLKYSKYEIKLERALELGYTACKVCKPSSKKGAEVITTNAKAITPSPVKQTPSKKAVATQCTGKTKAGKRCKRRTKNASGRCYQH